MTFEEILPLIKKGKKAVRTGWQGGELFIELKQELTTEAGKIEKVTPYLLIKTQSGYYSMFNPTVCDVLAVDWQVVDDNV